MTCQIGHVVSRETRRKVGLTNKGKTISAEVRKHMGDAHRGKKLSEEHKRNISNSLKGKIPKNINTLAGHNKGKKMPQISGEKCHLWKGGKKLQICYLCQKKFYDYKSNFRKFCSKKCWGIYLSKKMEGSGTNFWQGGKSYKLYTVDWTKTLKKSIRERDKYICQICGIEPSISCHHIDYDKKNCNPDNLIILCKSCHSKTNHRRKHWINYFYKKAEVNAILALCDTNNIIVREEPIEKEGI